MDTILEQLDKLIAPGEMSKEQALEFLELLRDEIDVRIGALQEEIRKD